jgi:hypothetical protein
MPLPVLKLFALGGIAAAIKAKLGAITVGGIGGAIWGFLSKIPLTALITSAFGFIFGQLMQFLTTGVQQILNFNWNQTDLQLDAQLEQAKLALASVAGGTLGNALGWLVCGAVPGAKIFVLNQPLGLEILRNVGEEALDEFAGNVRALSQLTFQSIFGGLLIQAYKNNRALFRKIRDGVGTILLFPAGGADAWKQYVEKAESEGRAVTFAEGIETTVEAIPNPLLRAFVDNAYDEFFDSCFEAGYVVANTIESHYLRNKAERGRTITITIEPNRKNPRERLLLQGTEQELIESLPRVMLDYDLLDNRDVGTMIASPPEEVIRRRPNARLLTITLKSTPRPPWRAGVGAGEYKETSIEIPDAKRNITWQKVKQACSGANGYLYGRFKAIATLNNYRTMSCFASTEDEARDRIKAYAELSEAEILFVDVVEEVKEGIRLTNPNLYKDPIRVYPAYFSIMAHEKILGGESGFQTTAGKLKRQRYVIDLWPETEPQEAAEIIRDLFSNQNL